MLSKWDGAVWTVTGHFEKWDSSGPEKIKPRLPCGLLDGNLQSNKAKHSVVPWRPLVAQVLFALWRFCSDLWALAWKQAAVFQWFLEETVILPKISSPLQGSVLAHAQPAPLLSSPSLHQCTQAGESKYSLWGSFVFGFCLSRATPTAHESSQARGLIQTVAATPPTPEHSSQQCQIFFFFFFLFLLKAALAA